METLKGISASKWVIFGLIAVGVLIFILRGFKSSRKNKISLRKSEKVIGKKIENLVFDDIPEIDEKIEKLKEVSDDKAKEIEEDLVKLKTKLEEVKSDERNIPLGVLVEEDDELWDLT